MRRHLRRVGHSGFERGGGRAMVGRRGTRRRGVAPSGEETRGVEGDDSRFCTRAGSKVEVDTVDTAEWRVGMEDE